VHDLEEGGAGRRLEAMSKAIDVSDRTGVIMCQGARVPDTGICVFFARLGGWCLSPRGGPGFRSSLGEDVVMTQWSCLRGES